MSNIEYRRKKRRRQKLLRIRRICAAVLAAMAIIAFIGSFVMRDASQEEGVYTEYTVKQGDTLWSICREYYGDSCDIRKRIADIRDINGIEDCSRIYPGMRIEVGD